MKRIKKTLGIACFCISLVFGIYALMFTDYPNSAANNEITVSNRV